MQYQRAAIEEMERALLPVISMRAGADKSVATAVSALSGPPQIYGENTGVIGMDWTCQYRLFAMPLTVIIILGIYSSHFYHSKPFSGNVHLTVWCY